MCLLQPERNHKGFLKKKIQTTNIHESKDWEREQKVLPKNYIKFKTTVIDVHYESWE